MLDVSKREISGKQCGGGTKIFLKASKIDSAEPARAAGKFFKRVSEERLRPVPIPFLKVVNPDG